MKVRSYQVGPVTVTKVNSNPNDTAPFHLHIHPRQEITDNTHAPITQFQEAIIDRLDHIVDLLTEIHHIDRLLLRNERKELNMAHEVRDAIQELVATTEEQTTVEAGLSTAIEGAVNVMSEGVERIIDLLDDLADNVNDAAAVREITAKLKRETSNMRESQTALVSATAPLAAAVQTNVDTTTGETGGSDTQPVEPPVEPPASSETEPEPASNEDEPLRTEGNI